jgi:hypothetical protein
MSDTVVLGRLQWHADKGQEEQEIGPPPAFPESLEELTARVARLVGKVSQSRDLKRPHPAIAKLLADDTRRVEEWVSRGRPSYMEQLYFSSPYEQRRLRILDTIFKALARAGITMLSRGKNPPSVGVMVGSTHVSFSLDNPKDLKETGRPREWRLPSGNRR